MTSPSFIKLRETLAKQYKCETFIHTWDTLESNTPTWHTQSGKVESTDHEEIKRVYDPTRLLVEKQPECSNEIVFHNQSKDGLVYAEYSKYRVNELKKEYGEFDLTLCIRPDIHFYSYEIPELEDTSKVWLGSVWHNHAASDIVCFSSSRRIDLLREYYKFHGEYISCFGNRFGNNETLMLKFMNDYGIDFVWSTLTMPKHWKIVRSHWPSVDYYESDRNTWDHNYDR